MSKNILVMFPTWSEAKYFVMDHGEEFEIVKAGVGLAECAARTAKCIVERKPDLLILAGFAGAYAGSGLEKGETVLVERENCFDLGSLRGDVFRPLSKSGDDPALNYYTCGTLLPDTFRKVTSNTVNTIAPNCGNGLLPRAGIENMEGAAFFAVCNALRVECAEIRTISNFVGEDPSEWIMDEAAARLADGVEKLTGQI